MSGGFARSLVALLAVALVVAVFATRGSGGSDPPFVVPVGADPAKIERAHMVLERRLSARRREIAAYRRLAWSCEDDLGAPRSTAHTSVWSLRRDVKYRERIRDLWKGRFAGCSTVLARRTIPSTNDWAVAVALVQRVHPGTAAWLLSCSDGEGGHSGFVLNHQGSGASGWLQFMPSTFRSHYEAAFADARSRGFVIDGAAESIYSPLGQALTGAYMRTHGMSSHWDPGVDPKCR